MSRACGLLLVAAGSLVLAGCAGESACPPARCGTVVAVSTAEPEALFPPLARSDVSVGLADLIFAKLADVGPDLNTVGDSGFVPVLAQSWRFDDSLTLRFRLRSDARWHDGAPLDAGDVAFTFQVYRDTLVDSPSRARLDGIAEVIAEDPATVLFRFTRSYGEQFFDAVYHMRILPRHLLDSVPPARLASHPFARQPVGSGPYRFRSWTAGQAISLEANQDFVLGTPGLGRVVWRFVPDPVAAVTLLLSGEADVMSALGGTESVARVAADTMLRIVRYPLLVYGFAGFNLRDPRDAGRPHPLFGDAELRRALAMAVDREELVRAVLGENGQVPEGPVGPALWIAGAGLQATPFDSARARQALAAMGWVDDDHDGVLERAGRRLEFRLLVPSSSGLRRRAAVILQEQLRRIGIAVRLDELEFNTFMDRAAAGRFDAYFGMWSQDPSPASIVETWTSRGIGGQNFGGYSNPAFDSLVARAMMESDVNAARALWREALGVIGREAPAIWLLAPTGVAGVHRRLRDVAFRPDQWTAGLRTWSVAPGQLLPRDSIPGR